MAKDVSVFVLSCDACQRFKVRGNPSLQPLPIPHAPWESVSLDFVVALLKTQGGYDAVCVFVDRLTKMVHLAPTATTVTAEQTARLLFDNVVRLHGFPKSIVSVETVVRMVGNVAASLQLPDHMRIHSTVHVSLLRVYRAVTTAAPAVGEAPSALPSPVVEPPLAPTWLTSHGAPLQGRAHP
jgi:hypothetical protein